jgi:hypothetical protein
VPPPPYLHVTIARSRAAVDEGRSSISRGRQPTCPECRSDGIDAVHGFALEAVTWTGEDVFRARGLPGIAIASARFHDLVHEHRLTNIRLERTEAYEWDAYGPLEFDGRG